MPSPSSPITCVLSVLLTMATGAMAGPINPPPGPVQGTMKTLAQAEPRIPIDSTSTPGDDNSVFKITQPGSYYLTGNVQGVAGRYGIEIASSNVTIDLMGFTLGGVPGSLDGVFGDNFLHSLAVRNGVVANWGGSGLNLTVAGGFGTGCLVESVVASMNGERGISAGRSAVVRYCVAQFNGTDGIVLPLGGVVTECAARENGAAGISTGSGSTITACSSRANTYGFFMADSCFVAQSSATFNELDGFVVNSDCHVRDNVADSNGNAGLGAGILCNGNDNRIERNNCTDGDLGIRVVGPGNLILANSCSGNTSLNWDVAAGNACLVVTASTSGAIAGDAGGTSPGSADPTVNYTY